MSVPTGPRRRRKDDLTDAGRLVADRRLALGLTQVELAELAGVGLDRIVAATRSGLVRLPEIGYDEPTTNRLRDLIDHRCDELAA